MVDQTYAPGSVVFAKTKAPIKRKPYTPNVNLYDHAPQKKVALVILKCQNQACSRLHDAATSLHTERFGGSAGYCSKRCVPVRLTTKG